jgi:hypothetical protein
VAQWVTFPLSGALNKNVDKVNLTANAAETENCYLNDAKGLSRFPSLTKVLDIPNSSLPVYLSKHKGDMIAVSAGRTYRVDENLNLTDITGATVSGGKRVIFTSTEDELVMAAGGKPVVVGGSKTALLSEEAPESTHVAWIGGYLTAVELDSGRFQYSSADSFYRTWNPLDVLSAEGRPDNIDALLVTTSGEMLLGGKESIEQFDQSPSGERPFYRRWVMPSGLFAPYTMIYANNRVWGVNEQKEFVAYSTQLGTQFSNPIQRVLENVTDWEGAYAMELPLLGQRFIVLHIPRALNQYNTEGITVLLDYTNRTWAELYGFSPGQLALPIRWDGWSYGSIGKRHFIGGTGKIYEIGGYSASEPQRMLWRSGQLQASGNNFSIEKLQITVKRGDVGGASTTIPPQLSMRVSKDGRSFGRWARRGLGLAGQQHQIIDFGNLGIAKSFQIEIEVTDAGQVEIGKIASWVDIMDE